MDKEKVLKTLGENIRKYRKEAGISLKELSNKTYIKKSYLEKIEEGEAKAVKLFQIFIIAYGLNIKPHILCEEL